MSTLAFQATEATVGADDFAALEQRILRAVDLLKAERSARIAAEDQLAELQQKLDAPDVGNAGESRRRWKPTRANATWCAPASNACSASSTSSQSDFS